MTVNDIRTKIHNEARNRTIISLYRNGSGLLFKAPVKSLIFNEVCWCTAKVIDIDFSISDYMDYDVELELIIE